MINLFREKLIKEKTEFIKQSIKGIINKYGESDFSNTDIPKLAERFVTNYSISTLEIIWDNDKIERGVTAKEVPIDPSNGEDSMSGTKTIAVVNYKIIHNQDSAELFKYCPTSLNPHQLIKYANVGSRYLSFDIDTKHPNTELSEPVCSEVVKERDKTFEAIKKSVESLNKDLGNFNNELRDFAVNELEKRKKELKSLETLKSKL